MSSELRRARNRQMIIFSLVCVGMLSLLGRLYYWQVLESGELSERARNQHIQNQVVNAPRGLIYDAQGRLLATNVVRDDVYIEPLQFVYEHPNDEEMPKELAQWLHQLHEALPDKVTEDGLHKTYNAALKKRLQTIRIAETISPEQSKKLRSLRLSSTFLEPRTIRTYPSGELAAQVLGYVQRDNSKGVYGIEALYNTQLTGKPGSFVAERDLMGNPLTVGASSGQQAVDGTNLFLTIDTNAQYIVQKQLSDAVKNLKAQSGTALVVDVRTGAIVAMTGAPTFDPNNYGDAISKKGCLGKQYVYLNPALFCSYEPGSTMKSITMAAALDQGLIKPDTAINDPGYLAFKDGTPTVRNWDFRAYGRETMAEVLAHSANVGAAHVAYSVLGPDRFYPYLERFGFGQPTGIGGPEETGFYNKPRTASWTPADLTRQAFGQAIQATPLQVAMAYQAIANGGVMMRPYVISSTDDNGKTKTTKPTVVRRVISAQAAKQLTDMLIFAADYNKQATFDGYSVAVKTGTATTQGLEEDQTEASMVGFVPASAPRFVILVKLDQPKNAIHGGTAAGPVWKAIAQQLMWNYTVPPDRP